MTALATRNEQADLPSQEAAHAIVGTIDQLKAVRSFIKAEFEIGYKDRDGKIVPGRDAGLIPGCGDKPTLFLPGAQKATMYFNCYPTYKVRKERLDDRGHIDVVVRCILISRASREAVGEGLGSCSTMEKKYRWRGNEKVCPLCGKPAIRKSKDKPEFYCWRKIEGCGATFKLNHPDIVSQGDGSPVENPDIYDVHNTVLKIAKKRAHVDAAITLGCLSELFTQDIEDTYQPAAVMEAARPYEGEVVEEYEPPPKVKTAPGLFSKEHQDRIPGFLDWLNKEVDRHAKAWREAWGPIIERAEADGHTVPAKIADPVNIHQMKNHLWKWAVQTGRIDGVDNHEGAKPNQVEGYLTMLGIKHHKDIAREIERHALQEAKTLEEKIYRKHPDLAPPGYFDNDEAAELEPASTEAVPSDDAFPEGRE